MGKLELSDIMADRKKGLLYMLAAVVMFSIGGLCIKVLPWSALAINGGRNALACTVIAIYMLATKRKFIFNKSVLLGAFSMCLTSNLFVIANKLTTAANTVVLQYTSPIFLILFSVIFFKYKPQRLDIITCVCVLSGIVCFFVDSLSAGGMLGNVIAVISGAAYATVCMLNAIPGNDVISSIFFGQLASAVIGVPFIFGESDFQLIQIAAVCALGIIQIGVAYVCFYNALELITPVDACLMTGIEPVLNPILVAVFYGEKIGPLSFVGAGIVIVSVLAYNVIRAKKAPEEAESATA